MNPIKRTRFVVRLLTFLAIAFCALGSIQVNAEGPLVQEKTFPGLNEVIPKATAIAAKMTEANATVDLTDSLEDVYPKITELTVNLNALEEQFATWEDIINWPLNRLMTAEASYAQIEQQQKPLFETISRQLKELEDLRAKWTTEKTDWNDWQTSLEQSGVERPVETFTKTRQSIDQLLQRISQTSSNLIKRQEQFSPTQQIITSRLALISKTLSQLRQETFRRNAFSLFSFDFYRQFTPELFTEYRDNLLSSLSLPSNFWQQHNTIVIIQVLCLLLLAVILFHRRTQTKPISNEWRFLFQHPVAGSIFITLAVTTGFYEKIPPFWSWLLLTIATISGTILVVAMVEKSRRRRLIKTLAAVFLVSESLKFSGLPTPAYQLYEVLLCAIASPLCLLIARRRHRQEPERSGLYLTSLYLISLFALIGLVTALLGFATLSTHLIDAVLGSIVIMFMMRIGIHLADGGITEALRLHWIQDRQFVKSLGISTAERLKTLARVFILVNALLLLTIVWNLYNDVDEAMADILSIEYSIGEFNLSVYMVVMVTLVLYLTNLTSWLLQAITDAHYMTPRKMDLGVKTALKRLLHYALFCIGFFIAVSMAGLDLQKFTIIAGALGVGIGFGLQNIVNNFVSGLILLFERPVKVGDTINIDDTWGTITRIGLRSTVFETLDRSEIIVPNSDLISQKVTNWTFTTNVSRIILPVGVAYGSPLDTVLEILTRAAKDHPDILAEPEVSAIFTGFGESSIDFELRAWISDIGKRLKVKSDLGQAIDRLFREEGITIPFPQRDLHLRSVESNLQSLLDNSAIKQSSEPQGPIE